jgi:hypothetical protein
MFLKNKYSRWYGALMASATAREAPREYTELHHIFPRCMGGGNAIINLVRLTYREHFLAHWLLTKMTIGAARTKMLYALSAMKKRHPCGMRIVAGWQYAIARRAAQEAGKAQIYTPERNAKISATLKGRVRPAEHSAAISKAKKGYRWRQDSLAKRSATMTGRKQSSASNHKRSATMKTRGPYPGMLENARKGREAAVLATRGVPLTVEHRAKIAAAQVAAWARGRVSSKRGAGGKFISNGGSA